jgi:hypothetical protein
MLEITVEEIRDRSCCCLRLILQGKLAGPGVEDRAIPPASCDRVRDARCGIADMLRSPSILTRVDSIGE